MKSYVYRVELTEEDDGRWSAVIPALPGCAVWGYTEEEAMEAIRDVAQAFVEVLAESGQPVPVDDVPSVLDGAAVVVSLRRTPSIA
ncbi:MAG TPA: type II toxin-antitoxin system HicB family antitoxin [Dehalococcoidia bacterium]|jgi:predicted RNase H-like HicB family nuclease|nr:type II toxin-antitoxin system HicB family antitoxin [Dehalococcoidia bacterium]